MISTALGALLALAVSSLWWTRRLAREAQARRRSDQQLEDIGRSLPSVAFRVVLDEDMKIKRSFFSHGVDSFLGIHTSVGGKRSACKTNPSAVAKSAVAKSAVMKNVLAAVHTRMQLAQAQAARGLVQSSGLSGEPCFHVLYLSAP